MASNEVQLLAKRGGKWVAITADGQQVVVSPGMKLTVGLSTQIEEPDTGEVKSLYDCYHDGTCPPDLEAMLPPKVEKVLENAPETPPNTDGTMSPESPANVPPMSPDTSAPPLGLPGGPAGMPPPDLGGAPPPGGANAPGPGGWSQKIVESHKIAIPPGTLPPGSDPAALPPPSGLPGGPGGPDVSALMGAAPDDSAGLPAPPLPRKGR
jgi:hypothetical protein